MIGKFINDTLLFGYSNEPFTLDKRYFQVMHYRECRGGIVHNYYNFIDYSENKGFLLHFIQIPACFPSMDLFLTLLDKSSQYAVGNAYVHSISQSTISESTGNHIQFFDPEFELFIWAVLENNRDMAQLFLGLSKVSIVEFTFSM